MSIGNYWDITLRALLTLDQCDLIYVEDNKPGKKNLDCLGLSHKSFQPFNEHNQDQEVASIVQALEEGKSIALTCDVGTPGLADPGKKLLIQIVRKGVPYEVLPGASSLVPALAAAPFSTEPCHVAFFLPANNEARLEAIKKLPQHLAVVIYETPYRLQALLTDILKVRGAKAMVFLAYKISQEDQQYLYKTVEQLQKLTVTLKGEFVLVLAPHGK